MESIIARALEYTLKYWLKSFSRDQFKLQGRTAQLSNLDINGDVLHASVGLPPAINVTTAKVGKLEITLPSVSNVQVEPILVQIDRLDLVLEENTDCDNLKSSSSSQSSTTSAKGSGYGFSDKIADGMTLEVGTVNLLLETRGGAKRQGGATWSPPLASITIRNLLLYTTNENWQVVNLKEARDFSNNKKYIYVFKKLEWQSLSVDLLPHPDMFTDARFDSPSSKGDRRDDDGAKRLFFGGERFLEGISGQANITVQRTEQNSPLGLEVQLHITEAVCPALSEPGLRAFLRFLTGLYVCLNRGDVDPKAQQHCMEAAGCSLVSIIVDHIFLCIRDAEFQLELLMQSLLFSRASISDGEITKNLSCIKVGGLFLRDTFSHPPCTLVQPSMQAVTQESLHVPKFGENFCPPIYPLGNQQLQFDSGVPLICLHSLQINPSPCPPKFASQTVISCQPLVITLQEDSCLRISSFLADGIVVSPGAVLPDSSVNSFTCNIKEFDLSIPLDVGKIADANENGNHFENSSFSGARLHVEDLCFLQSPSLKCTLLNLEKDPACFILWENQPIDASQRKWITRASNVSLSLETCSNLTRQKSSGDWSAGLWRCVELHDVCFEAAMATADGSPLLDVPPPEGVVRIGVACQKYLSYTSVEQLFFVLDLYGYFGRVGEQIAKVSRTKKQITDGKPLGEKLMKKFPSDTAVSLSVNILQLNFLESSWVDIQGFPLVQFVGEDLFLKVSHRTLGGAFAVSTNLHWKTVSVNCLDAVAVNHDNGIGVSDKHVSVVTGDGHPKMRAVFWVDNQSMSQVKPVPFLDIVIDHVMPYDVQDLECHSLDVSTKISGVRLGGGISYTESLLHRFGILGPDGGPGEGLLKGVKDLSSGPLAKLFKSSPFTNSNKHDGHLEDKGHGEPIELGMPDDLDVSIELKNWLFALEGMEEIEEGRFHCNGDFVSREDKCWHMTFQNLQIKGKSNDKSDMSSTVKLHKKKMFPVESFKVGVEGLRALKPRYRNEIIQAGTRPVARIDKDANGMGTVDNGEGINVEASLVIDEHDSDEAAKWTVENIKFSVKQPIEAVATKEELEHLACLCRSEVDSMGRIAAGILRVLKLDESLGQSTIDQLSNLGSGGFDRIFTPEKLSRRSSAGSISFSPRTPKANTNSIAECPNETLESMIAALEAEVSDSQVKCSNLVSEMSSSEDSRRVTEIKQLNQKLESIQVLLVRMRTLI